jgi:lysyl-tRNA synthetase class I
VVTVDIDPDMRIALNLAAAANAKDHATIQRVLNENGFQEMDQPTRRLLGALLGLACHYVNRYADATGTVGTDVFDHLIMTVALEDTRGDA